MCVEELLAIPIGSLPWRCGVGTRLLRLRHMNNSQDLRQIARVDSSDALQQWEPRFRLSRVTVAPVIPGAENQINLTVSGTVVGVKEVQTAKANI
jgi:phage baseplate assembly protein W